MRKISETTFCLIDSETTGPDSKTCELVEVGAALVSDVGRLYATYESLCKPKVSIPAEAMGVHGITNEDVSDAPSRAIVDMELRAFIPAGAIVVAHHAVFDSEVLDPAKRWSWTCSERLAHHVVPDAPNFKLGTLRYFFSEAPIDTFGRAAHRAIGDVLVLRSVWTELLDSWVNRCMDAGLPADDLDALLAEIASPYAILRMPLGKHRGALLADVPTSYFSWALSANGMTDIDYDLRWNMQFEIERRSGRARLPIGGAA